MKEKLKEKWILAAAKSHFSKLKTPFLFWSMCIDNKFCAYPLYSIHMITGTKRNPLNIIRNKAMFKYNVNFLYAKITFLLNVKFA